MAQCSIFSVHFHSSLPKMGNVTVNVVPFAGSLATSIVRRSSKGPRQGDGIGFQLWLHQPEGVIEALMNIHFLELRPPGADKTQHSADNRINPSHFAADDSDQLTLRMLFEEQVHERLARD